MKPYLKRAWAEISLPKLRKNVEIIKDNAKEGIKKKLAHYNEVVKENNTSQRSHNDRDEVR